MLVAPRVPLLALHQTPWSLLDRPHPGAFEYLCQTLITPGYACRSLDSGLSFPLDTQDLECLADPIPVLFESSSRPSWMHPDPSVFVVIEHRVGIAPYFLVLLVVPFVRRVPDPMPPVPCYVYYL